MGRTNPTSKRCRAPKTARGMAKHKLLRATILSRPRARAISALAAHRAIRKSRTPALHIASAVRENTKNPERMGACMGMPSVSSRALSFSSWGHVFRGSIRLQIVQRRVGEDIPRRADGVFPAGGRGLLSPCYHEILGWAVVRPSQKARAR